MARISVERKRVFWPKERAGRGRRTRVRSELWGVLDGLGGGCVTRDFGLIGLALGRGIGRVWWTGAVHNHVKWDECKFSCCEGRGRCRENLLCQRFGTRDLGSFEVSNLELFCWS